MANKEVHVGDDWWLGENNDGDLTFFNDRQDEVVKAIDVITGVFDFKHNDVINAGNITGGGEAGEAVYEFDTASDTWSINHNWDRHPDVVVAQGGEIVEAEVVYLNLNTIEVRFSKPQTGKAYLSF